MKGQSSLLLLTGKFDSSAMPRLQLTATSTFSLRIQGTTYGDKLSQALSETHKVADIHFCHVLPERATVADVRRYLDEHIESWRKYSQIVYYPTQLYFFDQRQLDIFLAKLAVATIPVMTESEPTIIALPSELLLHSSSELFLSDLGNASKVAVPSLVTNLSKWNGLFEISKVQTASRSFNVFTEQLPYLRKTCANARKGEQEYAYLSHLPPEVRAFFPHVGEGQNEGDRYFYDIEFLNMFDLGRFLIHGALDVPTVTSVLARISRYFEFLPKRRVSTREYREKLTGLYIEKLHQRLHQLKEVQCYAALERLTHSVFPGGVDGLAETLTRRLEKRIVLQSRTELHLIHGDLCFSNILYDRLAESVKFIDPRGADSPDELYLPLYYDLSKLSHSFLGGYDLIMSGLSTTEVEADLRVGQRFLVDEAYWHRLQRMFLDWCETNHWDIPMIRLGEASLFLSMLPLHTDRPGSMVKQFIAAVSAMNAAEA